MLLFNKLSIHWPKESWSCTNFLYRPPKIKQGFSAKEQLFNCLFLLKKKFNIISSVAFFMKMTRRNPILHFHLRESHVKWCTTHRTDNILKNKRKCCCCCQSCFKEELWQANTFYQTLHISFGCLIIGRKMLFLFWSINSVGSYYFGWIML